MRAEKFCGCSNNEAVSEQRKNKFTLMAFLRYLKSCTRKKELSHHQQQNIKKLKLPLHNIFRIIKTGASWPLKQYFSCIEFALDVLTLFNKWSSTYLPKNAFLKNMQYQKARAFWLNIHTSLIYEAKQPRLFEVQFLINLFLIQVSATKQLSHCY